MYSIWLVQSSMEHTAQVILYTLLMSERLHLSSCYSFVVCAKKVFPPMQVIYSSNIFCILIRYMKPIDSGLLYYLQSDHTQVYMSFLASASLLIFMSDFSYQFSRVLLFKDLIWLGWSCDAMNLQMIFLRHWQPNSFPQCCGFALFFFFF